MSTSPHRGGGPRPPALLRRPAPTTAAVSAALDRLPPAASLRLHRILPYLHPRVLRWWALSAVAASLAYCSVSPAAGTRPSEPVASRPAPTPRADTLAEHERGVTVALARAERPALRIGDHVDVIAVADDLSGGGPTVPIVIARRVRVLEVDDESGAVTIAVSQDRAGEVAIASATGIVSLVLAP